jgi:PAS domain S-box-containing protein
MATVRLERGLRMNTTAFDRSLPGALGLVAILIVAGVLNFLNIRRLNDDASMIDHTYEVMESLESVSSRLKETEAIQRTYLIVGGDAVPPEFDASLSAARQDLLKVKELTVDNATQQARMPEVQRRLEDLSVYWTGTMAIRKDQGFDAARQRMSAERSRSMIVDIERRLGQMDESERTLLRLRSERRKHTYTVALVAGVMSATVAVAGVVGFMTLLASHLAARTRAAQAIAEQGERLRTTLASIGDAVITTDLKARITSMNAVAESLTGWSLQEAAGQSLDAVFRIVNEETRKPVADPATRSLEEGVIVGLANHTILISRDGAERPIDDSAAPIRCKSGETVGCVLVFRDVTERRLVERDRADDQARLRSIVDHIVDGIITMDERGRIDSFNPAAEKLFGFRTEEVVGQFVTKLMPEPFRSEHEGYVANYMRTGQAKVIGVGREVVGRRKDGSTFPMDLAVSEFRLGDCQYFTGIVRDITDRKRFEQELRQVASELSEAHRRKDEFLATLAHELRNPLAAIRNGLQIIRLSAEQDTRDKALTLIERQLSQLVRLVDDLMDISRINRDKIELRLERVPLEEVINSAVETSRPLIDEMRHELTIALPPESIFLEADLTRLAQAFMNLLNNAAKYTDPGGQIRLTARNEGDQVAISVRDTGIGIPADKLTSIFEMFSQVDRSAERSQGGLGIGLSLVNRMIRMHGGTIEARSEGPGKGSEFVVRLPIQSGDRVLQRTEPPVETLVPDSSSRILVVDDGMDYAHTLSMLLKHMGNDVRMAHDGKQAILVAEEFRPDLVLLDLGLPVLDGYEAARRIREQPWGRHMVIVACFGQDQDEFRRKSREAGCDFYLVKPFDVMALHTLMDGPRPEAS